MYIIVGLGNPESKYDATFHNVGFAVVDVLAKKLDVKFKKLECKALISQKHINGEEVILAKPQTYMNLSGESVKSLVSKFECDLKNLIVVYDDLDIDVGTLRIRQNGSAGTHNGMRSIVSLLNSKEFPRIRVGIGRPENPQMQISDYVLSNVPKKHFETMNNALEKASDAILELINGKTLENVMNKFNG